MLPRHEENVAMNRLVLLALVGFVLATSLALPYSEDEDQVTNDEMEEVSNDFKAKEAETLHVSCDENWLSYKAMTRFLSIHWEVV